MSYELDPPVDTPLSRVRERLVRAGAAYPVKTTGTLEGAVNTGLSIALAVIDCEIEEARRQQWTD